MSPTLSRVLDVLDGDGVEQTPAFTRPPCPRPRPRPRPRSPRTGARAAPRKVVATSTSGATSTPPRPPPPPPPRPPRPSRRRARPTGGDVQGIGRHRCITSHRSPVHTPWRRAWRRRPHRGGWAVWVLRLGVARYDDERTDDDDDGEDEDDDDDELTTTTS